MAPEVAGHLPSSGIGSLMAYWRFYRKVAAAQLGGWLAPSNRRGGELLVDMSGPHLPCAAQAAAAGHTVVHVAPADAPPAGGHEQRPAAARPYLTAPLGGAAGHPARTAAAISTVLAEGSQGSRATHRRGQRGSLTTVRADPAALPFLDDHCVDGIIADDRTLSRHLFTEQVIAEAARVLRPGGRLLACFDSLVLGMAVLAEQRHWAELIDLPSAEVVLVPWPDGTITRCFGVDQLRELFAGAALDISWIRPRTVLSPTTVEHVLGRDDAALNHLVRAELTADPDESVGIHLIVNARKRRPQPMRRVAQPAG
ncbi:MAG TPA: methyltransferase domain-containing protein [Streptosporangiaceae bacterium]|nr:methyltransferase domain-containing protein [Streptosporangiaceae bacterium]